jgi:hypothetical protein
MQVNIDDGFLNLMDTDGASKDDVKVPDGDLGKEIADGFEEGKDLLVTIISAMNEEQVSYVLLSANMMYLLLCILGHLLQGSPQGRCVVIMVQSKNPSTSAIIDAI